VIAPFKVKLEARGRKYATATADCLPLSGQVRRSSRPIVWWKGNTSFAEIDELSESLERGAAKQQQSEVPIGNIALFCAQLSAMTAFCRDGTFRMIEGRHRLGSDTGDKRIRRSLSSPR
jgi:hypothetical protein